MADVAESAGISRATLYVHFKDKKALFDGLADNVVRESLRLMREAWRPDASFGANVEAAILAKDLPLHRLKHTSPHGGALLASNSESVVEYANVLEAGFTDFLCSRATEEAAGGRRFDVFGGVAAFGTFVSQAAAGFKEAIASEASYRTAIRTFAAVIEAATSAGAGKRRG